MCNIKLLVRPEMEALRLSKITTIDTIIVCIEHPKCEKIIFPNNPHIKGIFKMRFYDLDIGETYHLGLTPARQKNFNGLKNFIDENKDKVEQIIVCCPGGISRSAGTAAAIGDYLKLDYHIWNNKIYHPNLLVYKLACNEFGIGRTQEQMDDVFNSRLENSMFHDKNLDVYYERNRKRNLKKQKGDSQ